MLLFYALVFCAVSGTTHCIAIRSTTAATLRTGDEDRLAQALSMQAQKLGSGSGPGPQRAASNSLTGMGGAGEGADEGSGEEKHTLA